MALEYNIYLTTMKGGPWRWFTNLRRPVLFDQMIPADGEEYQDLHYPQRQMSLLVVRAQPARHVVFQAISGVTRILPFVSLTGAQIRTNLDKPLVDLLTGAKITEMRNAFESNGIDTDWATSATTFRDLIRYLLRRHRLGQLLEQGGDTAKAFLTANLTATVGSIPNAARNRISAWMASRGLATAWITGATTVRQVLRYIHNNLSHTPIKIMGEEF